MRKYKYFWDAPAAVQKRYWSIKYANAFVAPTENLARFYSRQSLKIKERKRKQELIKAIKSCQEALNRARKQNNQANASLLNLGLFFLIADRDVQAMKLDALTHPDRWKRNLSLRIIVLTICELDVSKATDRRLQELMTASNVSAETQSTLSKSMRQLRKSQAKASKALHGIRNNTIAHRNGDAIKQMQQIESLSQELVLEAAADFYESSELFLKSLTQTLFESGGLTGCLSYFMNSKQIKNQLSLPSKR